MARNIHQNRKIKNRNPSPSAKPAVQAAAAAPLHAAVPVSVKPAMPKPAVHQADALRFAELPHELRRIAFFTAFVVVLLIVLWFFLK